MLQDFRVTSNKQQAFVQQIWTMLKVTGTVPS